MYQMAKTAREKMKAKARSLAAPGTLESGQKTTTATWSPAEALDADVKTGARPVGKGARLYNKGGKVSGVASKPRADRKARKAGGKVEKEIGIGMANKDVRAANELRDGKKHIGAFKKGGEVKDAGVKDKKALGDIDPSPKRGAFKSGGAVKYAKGGKTSVGAELTNKPLASKGLTSYRAKGPYGYIMIGAKDHDDALKEARRSNPNIKSENLEVWGGSDYSPINKKSGGSVKDAGVKDKKALGAIDPSPKRGPAGHYKKGGKIGRADGGRDPSYVGSESVTEDNKPVMRPRDIQDKRQREPQASDLYSSDQLKRLERGYTKGGRTARATGGLIGAMKGAKKASKKGAKTDINIVINAGHKAPMRHSAAGMMPPGGDAGLPPMPPPGAGAPPPAMPMGAPPMPPGAGPGLPPGLPGRKTGGRITKVASSYKDMEAGAASGEGRLQKTDIESRHTDAPARKAGGRISKVAKSYKDMTAGAGDGEGRLQKTDIAKAKKIRGK